MVSVCASARIHCKCGIPLSHSIANLAAHSLPTVSLANLMLSPLPILIAVYVQIPTTLIQPQELAFSVI